MNKRDFIKGLGLFVGASAAAQLTGTANAIAVAQAYTPRPDSLASDGKIFTQAEMQLLHDICRQVIPATDTPGAHEVDVHGFVDNQLSVCHGPEEQQNARSTIQLLDARSLKAYNAPFADTSDEEQLSLLVDLENAAGGLQQCAGSEFQAAETADRFRLLHDRSRRQPRTAIPALSRRLQRFDSPWTPEDRNWF